MHKTVIWKPDEPMLSLEGTITGEMTVMSYFETDTPPESKRRFVVAVKEEGHHYSASRMHQGYAKAKYRVFYLVEEDEGRWRLRHEMSWPVREERPWIKILDANRRA